MKTFRLPNIKEPAKKASNLQFVPNKEVRPRPLNRSAETLFNELENNDFWIIGRRIENSLSATVFRGTVFRSVAYPITALVNVSMFSGIKTIWRHDTLGSGSLVKNNNGIRTFIADSGERESYFRPEWMENNDEEQVDIYDEDYEEDDGEDRNF